MQSTTSISIAMAVVWVFVGIIVSLLLPVAVRVLRQAKLEEIAPGGKPTIGQRLAAAWVKYGGNRYVAILFAASLVAIILVFLLGLEFSRPRDAVLAGFAWESLLSKLLTPAGGK